MMVPILSHGMLHPTVCKALLKGMDESVLHVTCLTNQCISQRMTSWPLFIARDNVLDITQCNKTVTTCTQHL